MTGGPCDIDEIVRRVIARLRASGPGENSAKGDTLVVPGNVLSAAALDGRLGGVRRVVIGPRAVVTPAAHDLLKRHGVEFSRRETTQTTTNDKGCEKSSGAKLVLATSDTQYDPALLVAAASRTLTSVDRLPDRPLADAIAPLDDAMHRGQCPGVLLTRRTAAAACLANRRRGMRAAAATSVNDVTNAIDDVAVNLLVVDPAGKSMAALRVMLQRLAAAGWRDCPTELRGVLES
jgi:hypothetical protein